MDFNSFLSFFLEGDNPVAFQLWYLIALIYISSICFTILYFLNIKWLFYLFIPFLFLSVLIQVLAIRSLPEIVYYTFFLLPFFIFGCFQAYHQHSPQDRLSGFEPYFPALFLILMVISSILLIFFRNEILIYFSCFFFPFFISALFVYLKKIKIITSFFLFCGTYSFQIYLFHWPLVLPVVTRIIMDIFKIDYFFMPVVITILAIYLCVFSYKIVKKIHLNVLFE